MDVVAGVAVEVAEDAAGVGVVAGVFDGGVADGCAATALAVVRASTASPSLSRLPPPSLPPATASSPSFLAPPLAVVAAVVVVVEEGGGVADRETGRKPAEPGEIDVSWSFGSGGVAARGMSTPARRSS